MADMQLSPSPNTGENEPMMPAPAALQRTRLYTRRWFMLLIFCSFSFSSAFQWIHLNIITNIVIKYYNQSLPESKSDQQLAVAWLSIMYMACYVPLVFPATYLLNRKGLHFCCIVGSSMTAIGAWIKAAAVSPDSFPLLFAGQTIVAAAQIFVLEVPPHLAALWFGENEVSTATAIGVFGNQVGIAVGFLVPPVIVKDSDNLDEIGVQLRYLLFGTGILSTLVFFAVLIFFRAKPPLPPTLSTHHKQNPEESVSTVWGFLRSLGRLFTNWGFVILMITYGMNTGSFYAVGTVLNPIILAYFKNAEEDAGRIGLTIVLAGVLGSVLAGIFLDQTKAYKLIGPQSEEFVKHVLEKAFNNYYNSSGVLKCPLLPMTTLGFYIFSMVGMLAFTIFLELVPILWIIYVVAGLLGFFMTGYLPVGFEFAAEITYPEPEGTSSGMLNASAQVFGIGLTIALSLMVTEDSGMVGNIVITSILVLGSIGTALIKSDLRRQRANKHFSTVASNLAAAEGSRPVSKPPLPGDPNLSDGITIAVGNLSSDSAARRDGSLSVPF